MGKGHEIVLRSRVIMSHGTRESVKCIGTG